jgi:hypothetical protein
MCLFSSMKSVRRTWLILVACSVLAFPVVHARQNKAAAQYSHVYHNGFVRAEVFLKFDEANQRAYAMGLLDGMYMAPAFGAPDNSKLLMKLTSCVEGMNSSQVAAIMGKYVQEHPERWDWDMKNDGYEAMIEACEKR